MVNTKSSSRKQITEWIILGGAILVTAFLFGWFAQQVNIEDSRIAFDWKMFWHGIEDGRIHWRENAFILPPWSLIFVLPLGFFSLRVSWGLIMFFTFAALFVSVPRNTPRIRYGLALILLMTSFPALRNFADANVEAYLIGGILLIIYAYREDKPVWLALGLLLAAIKPQTIFLFYLAIGIYILWTKPLPFILKSGLITLAAALPPTLLLMKPWLDFFTSTYWPRPLGISISGSLTFFEFPQAAIIAIQIVVGVITIVIALAGNRELSRCKVGMLVAGSILVTPYASGLTMIVALAIGVVPLFLEKPALGAVLFVLYNLFYLDLLTGNFFGVWSGPYSTLVILITWIILGVMTYQQEIGAQGSESEKGQQKQTPVPA